MGDFNINLLNWETDDGTNLFYNNLTSNFFTPFILQPTRLISKTLIDNMFLNTIEYPYYSGNLTIQTSDHLCQFVILQGFYKELFPKKIKYFAKQGFVDNSDWNSILALEDISTNNIVMSLNLCFLSLTWGVRWVSCF